MYAGDLGRTRGCHPETSASAMDHALAAMGDLAQIGVQQFQVLSRCMARPLYSMLLLLDCLNLEKQNSMDAS